MAHSFDYHVEAVVFPMSDPMTHAENRMSNDSRGLTKDCWFRAADAQIKRYEIPSHDEGFDTILYLEKDWKL